MGPVSTWMGDRQQADKPSRYVTSHSGQLSLAIPPSASAIVPAKAETWHTARCSSPVSVVSQCKLGVWLTAKETETSATLWPLWLGKDFTFRLRCSP